VSNLHTHRFNALHEVYPAIHHGRRVSPWIAMTVALLRPHSPSLANGKRHREAFRVREVPTYPLPNVRIRRRDLDSPRVFLESPQCLRLILSRSAGASLSRPCPVAKSTMSVTYEGQHGPARWGIYLSLKVGRDVPSPGLLLRTFVQARFKLSHYLTVAVLGGESGVINGAPPALRSPPPVPRPLQAPPCPSTIPSGTTATTSPIPPAT
jgi:hypothetical protein